MSGKQAKIAWLNKAGERMEHALWNSSIQYARDWWHRSILECQDVLNLDKCRDSKLRLDEMVLE